MSTRYESTREDAKQHRHVRRLLAMHAITHLDRPLRPVAWTALRTALAVVGAMLLILVVLPALLAVQAASI
jgi:hypothetical protein